MIKNVFETDLEPNYGITLNLTFGKGTKDIDIITLPDGQAFPAEDIDHDLVELSEDGAIWEDEAKVPCFLAYLEEQGTVKRVRQKGRPDRFQALDPEALHAWYHEGFLPACAEFFRRPEPDEDEEQPITEGIRGFCDLYDFRILCDPGQTGLGDSYEYGQIVRRDQPDVIDYHMVTIWRNGMRQMNRKG